jgi:hypothetical protein
MTRSQGPREPPAVGALVDPKERTTKSRKAAPTQPPATNTSSAPVVGAKGSSMQPTVDEISLPNSIVNSTPINDDPPNSTVESQPPPNMRKGKEDATTHSDDEDEDDEGFTFKAGEFDYGSGFDSDGVFTGYGQTGRK